MEEENQSKANEPIVPYGKLTITTLEQLSEMDRNLTRNMTHEERMAYLHKLITITHGDDLSKQEKEFYNGRIRINRAE
jgi:hypothetical protein